MTSAPVFPVEGAVLDGFGDVGGGEAFNARKVGDGAGHFEDAVVRAGTQAQFVDGEAENFFRGGVDGAMGFNACTSASQTAFKLPQGKGVVPHERGFPRHPLIPKIWCVDRRYPIARHTWMSHLRSSHTPSLCK